MKKSFILFFSALIYSILTAYAYAQTITATNSSPTVSTPQSSIMAPSSATPTPTIPISANAFNYTPLPAISGPQNDIAEIQPLTASRPSAQVDDYITFSVTIKNVSPYGKLLQNVCFESTDGNFGCQNAIPLIPGQTFTLNNVGTWTTPGTKNIWITWSQDGFNYYQPVDGKTIRVTIL